MEQRHIETLSYWLDVSSIDIIQAAYQAKYYYPVCPAQLINEYAVDGIIYDWLYEYVRERLYARLLIKGGVV